MSTKTALAIDLGAESGRVVAVHLSDNTIHTEELHRFPNIPMKKDNTLHWQVFSLWNEIKKGIAKGKNINPLSLGVDTWGVDFALLDEHGELLDLPVHYRDERTQGMMERVFEIVSKSELYQQTGIQFLSFNSLYQMMSLAIKNSSYLNNAKTFLTIPDLFNYWLTGKKVCEFSNATTTQMYNPILKDWTRGTLSALKIPAVIFPEIIYPGTKIGEYQGIPVIVPACHDTGSAVAGIPATSKNFAYISSGTWSLVGLETDYPVINETALKLNVTNEGGVFNTNRLLKNVIGLWIVQQCREAWLAENKNYSYHELTGLAATAPKLRSFFNPNDERLLKPGNHPQIIQEMIRASKQNVPNSHSEIIRCVFESLALAYASVIEDLKKLTSQSIEVIHVVGGGSKNSFLNQLTANAIGVPVIAGPAEATVIGNALVQFIALREIGDLNEGRKLVSQRKELKWFYPEDKTEWQEAYRRYKSIMVN